jgi:hypothetical protein
MSYFSTFGCLTVSNLSTTMHDFNSSSRINRMGHCIGNDLLINRLLLCTVIFFSNVIELFVFEAVIKITALSLPIIAAEHHVCIPHTTIKL